MNIHPYTLKNGLLNTFQKFIFIYLCFCFFCFFFYLTVSSTIIAVWQRRPVWPDTIILSYSNELPNYVLLSIVYKRCILLALVSPSIFRQLLKLVNISVYLGKISMTIFLITKNSTYNQSQCPHRINACHLVWYQNTFKVFTCHLWPALCEDYCSYL